MMDYLLHFHGISRFGVLYITVKVVLRTKFSSRRRLVAKWFRLSRKRKTKACRHLRSTWN